MQRVGIWVSLRRKTLQHDGPLIDRLSVEYVGELVEQPSRCDKDNGERVRVENPRLQSAWAVEVFDIF